MGNRFTVDEWASEFSQSAFVAPSQSKSPLPALETKKTHQDGQKRREDAARTDALSTYAAFQPKDTQAQEKPSWCAWCC